MTSPSPASEKFHGSTTVSFTVKDIHKSAAWYQNVVGFGVDRTFEREGRLVFVALKAGDVRINLNQSTPAWTIAVIPDTWLIRRDWYWARARLGVF